MLKRTLGVVVFVLGCLVLGQAAVAQEFKEGVHYIKLDNPVPTSDKNKIEVLEFFWYGCGHCYHFEPLAKAWKSQQADDVVFVRSPAMWNKTMQAHARLFYTVKLLNALDKVDDAIFAQLTKQQRSLESIDDQAAFVAKHGVDEKAFREMASQFGVDSLVRQADARARSVMIEGTPELLVNGKYRVTSRMAGSQAKMLQVASYLVEQERQAQ